MLPLRERRDAAPLGGTSIVDLFKTYQGELEPPLPHAIMPQPPICCDPIARSLSEPAQSRTGCMCFQRCPLGALHHSILEQ